MTEQAREFSGKTVEDAIAAGLSALNATENQVEIEIVNKGSRGILGFGSEPALVNMTLKSSKAEEEVAGLSPKGHSDRTSGMAIEVGQDLGMTPDEVTDLQYSALMHDIGRITLNEPSILKMGFTDEDIARWGA